MQRRRLRAPTKRGRSRGGSSIPTASATIRTACMRVGKYLEWVRDGWLRAQSAADRSCSKATRSRSSTAIAASARSSASSRRKLGIAKAAQDGHRDGRPAQLRASRARRRLGRDGGRREGQVSLHFLNTSGAQRVAPFGGSDRRLSTNPITIGVPVAGGDPVDSRRHDVDGRRRQADGRAATRASSVPAGWIIDKHGAADDRPEGVLRRRRAAHRRRAQGLGPVDRHRPAGRRGVDGHAARIPTTRCCATTCCRSTSRPRSTTPTGGVAARSARFVEWVKASPPCGAGRAGAGARRSRAQDARGAAARAAFRSTTRRWTTWSRPPRRWASTRARRRRCSAHEDTAFVSCMDPPMLRNVDHEIPERRKDEEGCNMDAGGRVRAARCRCRRCAGWPCEADQVDRSVRARAARPTSLRAPSATS